MARPRSRWLFFLSVGASALIVVAAMLGADRASAGTQVWNVASGDWSVASNWSGAVPTASDYSLIDNGGTAIISTGSATCYTLMLGDLGGSGTLRISGGSLNVGNAIDCGYPTTGTIIQSAGSTSISGSGILYLGLPSGSRGDYNLSGGALGAGIQYIGYRGTGSFTQTGGTNSASTLYFSYISGSGGEYILGDGLLSASSEYVGYVGSGVIKQSGGTNNAASLYLGNTSGSSGAYILSGSGQLVAGSEYVGSWTGAGLFQQSGGMNNVANLSIAASSTYLLTGGTLTTISPLAISGTLDCANSPATINFTGPSIIDFTTGTIVNTSSTALSIGANSLLIVPANMDPATAFSSFSNAGLTHVAGTVLTISAGQVFSSNGTINDPVNCQGTISALGGSINLNGGLTVTGTGVVDLSSYNGRLVTENTSSGIAGGSLRANTEYVGNSGTGSFTQAGGTNTISALYLGNNSGSSGNYMLAGGLLSSTYQFVGYSGTGSFTQTGGTNSGNTLYLGTSSRSGGTYTLAGGSLSSTYEYVGYSGTGSFTQSGGTNAVSSLYLADNAGSRGSYSLGGSGQLTASFEYVGYAKGGTGLFQQSGGINNPANLSIANSSAYFLTGGTLATGNSLTISGTLDCGNLPSVLSIAGSGIVDFSQGTVINTASTALSIAASTLLIVPANMDPATSFFSYSNSGVAHMAGTVFHVSAGELFSAFGTIRDPVSCQGTIAAIGQPLVLAGGLFLSGTGVVNLDWGTGSLITDNTTSAIVGGSLTVPTEQVGVSGTGSFTQAGGTNSFSDLDLGFNSGSTGSYSLSGGMISSTHEAIGNSGTGSFSQAGGANTVSAIYIGYNSGSLGSYVLSGGTLNVYSLWVGYRSAGSFTQGGGLNSARSLTLGAHAGGQGYYTLTGGTLSSNDQEIGTQGNGVFTQSGGTNSVATLDVGGYSSTGSYSLSGSARLSGATENIGSTIQAAFTQSGGTNSANSIVVGSSLGNNSYDLSSGSLYTGALYVGENGNGTFRQSGGTNSVLDDLNVGYNKGNGAYFLSGGSLHAAYEFIGYSSYGVDGTCGTGSFTQSGGTNLTSTLDVVRGSYTLTGTSLLTSDNENIGGGPSGWAQFQQSGGLNKATQLTIASGTKYLLTGGTLAAGSGLVVSGTLDCGNSLDAISIGGSNIVDFSKGVVVNTGSTALTVGANSLLIVPATMNPGTAFGSYSNAGVTYRLGTMLTIPAGQNIRGVLTINDMVSCQGILSAAGSSINLNGGLILTGAGSANLGSSYGSLVADNMSSQIAGGSLVAPAEYVGKSSTGSLTQSGGSNSVASLRVGYNSGSFGTYSLSGSGQLTAASEYIGNAGAGAGVFQQSGGMNNVVNLSIAGNSTYLLTGGTLAVSNGIVGSGTLDGGNSPATISIGPAVLVDLGQASLIHTGSTALSIGANSLLIVPANFDPATAFGSFSNAGLTHTAGTVLTVPAEQGFSGNGTLSDPVSCQGTITATGGSIGFLRGLNISATGVVDLGSSNGSLLTENTSSGMAGGSLIAANQYVGYSGTGSFTQSGGTNSTSSLYLGNNKSSSGNYSLSGGSLSAGVQYLGYSGSGSFTQSGGTNAVSSLQVGYYSGSFGTYSLSGSGLLSAGTENIGNSPGGTGLFQQSGGINNVANLSIASSSTYRLTGGTLATSSGLFVSGTLDCGNSPTTIQVSGPNITDFTKGTIVNTGSTALSIGANSLFIVPPGMDPVAAFGSFSNSGLTHVAGTVLTVPAGQFIKAYGTISDPVICEGTFNAVGGSITFSRGLSISGTGVVDLGSSNGTLRTENASSTMSGGSLIAAYQNIGVSGTGSFAQTGGTNSEYSLSLGNNTGSSGTYSLSNGLLFSPYQSIGIYGTGNLTQSGGTNSVSTLYLGEVSGGSGMYSLTGGSLSAGVQNIGYSGSGSFTQSGGTNSVSSLLLVNYGSYSLSGSGLLSAGTEHASNSSGGLGSFQQSGGMNAATQLIIDGGAKYHLTGGTLATSNGIINNGVLDCGNSPSTILIGSSNVIDLTRGTIVNTGSTAISIGANSLLIVPASMDPATAFGSFSNAGVTYRLGTTLTVPAGQSISGTFTANDLVNCQGAITAVGGPVYLYGGLILTGTGAVDLSSNNSFLPISNGSSGIASGSLVAASESVDISGTGSFTQSGGTNVAATLYIDRGGYVLSGSGLLSASMEHIGYSTGGAALFQQSGGLHNVANLSIFSGSRYLLAGGTMAVSNGFVSSGTLDGGNSPAVFNIAGPSIVDFTQGAIVNTGSTALSIGANSLLIVPANMDPATTFGSFNNAGLTHVAGTVLMVAAGQGFSGNGTINDPVICQGTITASGGSIGFTSGLTISGTGIVDMGSRSGSFVTENTSSAIAGGSLIAAWQYVGNNRTGSFTQTGGTNSGSNLVLGYNTGSSGSYSLTGGSLSAESLMPGLSGTGSFTQTGGTSSASWLYLGFRPGGSGMYNLSNGLLVAQEEYVGLNGAGTFTQSGGTNSVYWLSLGSSPGSSGSYNLNGGLLSVYSLSQYTGAAAFNFSGGTLQAAPWNLSSSVPMNLLGTSTFDSNGNSMTLSGALSGSGSLLKVGDGTLTLSGSNSYQGGTTVSGGTLVLQGAASLLAGSSLTIGGGSNPTAIFTPPAESGATDASSGLAVPEPNTCLLVVAAAAGLGFWRRLRRVFSFPATASILIIVAAMIGADRASAGTQVWEVASGDWNVASNWSSTVPVAGDNVLVDNGGTVTNASSSATCDRLTLGDGAGSGTLQISGGSLNVGSEIDCGSYFAGTIIQSAGTAMIGGSGYLRIGNSSSGSGSYALSGGSLYSGTQYIGNSGTGSFSQSGGTNSVSSLYAGYGLGSSGEYTLSGGLLRASIENIGRSGTGSFTQTAGTNSASSLFLGYYIGGECKYLMTGGSLSIPAQYIGSSGTGSFSQSGGTNSVSSLYLGFASDLDGNGSYSLSGCGLLSAGNESIGRSRGGTGLFQQSGGVNKATNLSIAKGNTYLLTGGTLTTSNAMTISGTLDCGNSPATINFAGPNIVDFTQGAIVNTGSTALSIGAKSLLIVPASFDPVTAFGSFSNAGLTHVAGTILTVPAGQGFSGSGTISDPVNCQGTITAVGGLISFSRALSISGTGVVDLGSYNGSLDTENTTSGIAGGSLIAAGQYVGKSGTGSFTQTGGINSASALYLGGNSGSNGNYFLSGGSLRASDEYIGLSGTARFTQTGGTNSTVSLTLAGNVGSSGNYGLTGGSLSSTNQYVGNSGKGSFTHSGGTNSVSSLYLGFITGSSGGYSLSGTGQLVAGNEYIGYATGGAGRFQQSGGINNAANLSIASGSTYLLTGGTLTTSNGLTISGTLDCGNSPATIDITGPEIVDFTKGTIVNTGSTALAIAANSLVLVPANMDPATAFGSYSNAGVTYKVGSVLTVAAGEVISTFGTIGDPVICQGTITATGGSIGFARGLSISGTGVVDLGSGSGSLVTENASSGIAGGSLVAADQYVAVGGTGSFTQTGGTNSASTLYLGYNSGSSGGYALSGGSLSSEYLKIGVSGTGSFTQTGGTNSVYSLGLGDNSGARGNYALIGGSLSSTYQYVGDSGMGSFTQTGGTNSAARYYLGYSSGGSGSYTLSGGSLSSRYIFVGGSGTGVFTQAGGTNSVLWLYLGLFDGSSGSYNLNGGLLSLNNLRWGKGIGEFDFSGGTLQAAPWNLSSSVPMNLLGTSTFDSNGHSMTLSGALSGSGSLLKVGDGTLTLSGSNSYSGGTTVSGGTLVLQGAASLLAGSSLTIGGGSNPTAIFTPPAESSATTDSSGAAVPEPNTCLLVVAAAAVGLAFWRRLRRVISSSVGASALIIVAAMIGADRASAGTQVWEVASGDWNVASNWGGTVPSSCPFPVF